MQYAKKAEEKKGKSSQIETHKDAHPSLPPFLKENVRGHAVQELLLHGQNGGQGPSHDDGPLVVGAGEGLLLLQDLHHHARRVQLPDKGAALREEEGWREGRVITSVGALLFYLLAE